MTQDRLVTAWDWRPMVGSAVATMVWSSAARNIVTIRLIRMVRVSAAVSGARGASDGASSTASTSEASSGSSASISSAKVWRSAGKRLCRSYLFMERDFVPGTAAAAQIRWLRFYLEG